MHLSVAKKMQRNSTAFKCRSFVSSVMPAALQCPPSSGCTASTSVVAPVARAAYAAVPLLMLESGSADSADSHTTLILVAITAC